MDFGIGIPFPPAYKYLEISSTCCFLYLLAVFALRRPFFSGDFNHLPASSARRSSIISGDHLFIGCYLRTAISAEVMLLAYRRHRISGVTIISGSGFPYIQRVSCCRPQISLLRDSDRFCN